MPEHAESDELMSSLLAKLNQIILGGEEGEPSPNYFCTWCAPGIPYPESDFEFMQRAGTQDADELRRLNQQAYIWSRFVDFIPDLSGTYDGDQQDAIFQTAGRRLSFLWEIVLRMSDVAATPLTDQQREALRRVEDVLSPTRVELDPISGEEIKRTATSPLELDYDRFRTRYETAVIELNAKRIAATVGADAQAVADWQFNASAFRARARQAMNAWVTQGRKMEYERLVTFKASTLARSLSFLRDDLQQRYRNALLTSIMDNQEFPVTGVVPPNFAEAAGWTDFSFQESEHHHFQRSSATRFSGRAGLGFGPFRLGARAGFSREDRRVTVSGEDFSMGFEVVQAPILRSWFEPWFLEMRAWRFPPNLPQGLLGGEIEALDSMMLSDGEDPPRGHMIAYPVSAICARNIRIRFRAFEDETSEVRRHVSGGGSVGWGPFRLGGSYQRDTHQRQVDSSLSRQGLESPGMQVIGFKNYIVPRSPFPHPDIEQWESGEDPTEILGE